jgi:hypothetical protein
MVASTDPRPEPENSNERQNAFQVSTAAQG